MSKKFTVPSRGRVRVELPSGKSPFEPIAAPWDVGRRSLLPYDEDENLYVLRRGGKTPKGFTDFGGGQTGWDLGDIFAPFVHGILIHGGGVYDPATPHYTTQTDVLGEYTSEIPFVSQTLRITVSPPVEGLSFTREFTVPFAGMDGPTPLYGPYLRDVWRPFPGFEVILDGFTGGPGDFGGVVFVGFAVPLFATQP